MKLTLLCEPSQNGLLAEEPQRERKIASPPLPRIGLRVTVDQLGMVNGCGLSILEGMSGVADRLIEAMTRSAPRRYGQERVTELAHALQCAELADKAGADLIAPHVPERVAFLIRAHADAKRYLCAAEPGYYDTLSTGSKHTLTLQGGVMTAEEMRRAATNPSWSDVLRLRRWDDQAKVADRRTSPLDAWPPLLRKYLDTSDVRR